MPIITFGRFALDVTLKTSTTAEGLAGFLLVNHAAAGPKLGSGQQIAWPEAATPSEWVEFHRQEDALLQAAGVPAKLRKHPDLWQYRRDDPAREAHRLRLVEQNAALGVFPYTAYM